MIPSLKRRLTISVIALFTVSWLVSALATSITSRAVLQREVDRVLESLLLVAESVGQSLTGELSTLQKTYSDNMVPIDGTGRMDGTPENPAIVRLRGTPSASSPNAPRLNIWTGGIQLLVGKDTPIFPNPRAYGPPDHAVDLNVDGVPWRVLYRHDEASNTWYAAGMTQQQARIDGVRLLLQMMLPLAIVIPLTILALYYSIAHGLGPLRRLAREIEDRRQQASLQPVPLGDAPLEMVPVVNSLNHLLERLTETLENEQRFTANAAHELKTPLAAISTEVQLCQRLAKDTQSRAMMERIRARVERASHSVRQLLVLARLDPPASLAVESLNLSDQILEVISELGHLARERDLEIDYDVAETKRLVANRQALLILLRNLVGNAFRYTPAGGRVRIAALADGLNVENDSKPITHPARLADRFYRGNDDASDGTGLGLSIVKRICELHGFALALQYRPGDRRFVVRITVPQTQ